MKANILKFLVLLLPFTLTAAEEEHELSDQVELCLGGTYFMIFKAMAKAQDQGYPYVKILSYELHSDTERLSFSDTGEYPKGEQFEILDDDGKIEIACFRENTNDCLCINIQDYAEVIANFREFDKED